MSFCCRREDLAGQIVTAAREVLAFKELTNVADMAEIADMGTKLQARLAHCAQLGEAINEEEVRFGMHACA